METVNGGRAQAALNSKAGFTLVELVVVIAIIGLLVAMLMPAVQQVRSSARQTFCRNNLRQLGLAFSNIEASHGHFPSNGWGYYWHGDPNFGIGKKQPGGWTYQILPWIEQNALAEKGKGLEDPQRRIELGHVSQQPVKLFICPSRRSAIPLPYTPTTLRAVNWEPGDRSAKTDYAVNAGDVVIPGVTGPEDWSQVDSYRWPDLTQATGIAFLKMETRTSDILDGLSNTLMLGEKALATTSYVNGSSIGDDQSCFIGDDADNRRWGYRPPVSDRAVEDVEAFGSPHFGLCLFVRCDGSVDALSKRIDIDVMRSLSNRRDGRVASGR